MNIDDLKYVLLDDSIPQDIIDEFDCGHEYITYYLHRQAVLDRIHGKGVTYVLMKQDKKKVYAYATIHTFSLYYYEDIPKGQVLMPIPTAEIKMFAIRNELRGQTIDGMRYSEFFFQALLEKLYELSMNVIGFQMLFLRANELGEHLYRQNGFQDCTGFFDTYDEAAKGCTPLVMTLDELGYLLYAN